MLHISLRGVNGRLWCSHSVFKGHSGCSGLSNNILAGEISLGGGRLRVKEQGSLLGSDTLCRYNFEHNTMDGASSIMLA